MSERRKKFTVERSKWLRGDCNLSVLLDERGRMCCLGFVSAQCGVPSDALLDVTEPNAIGEDDALRIPLLVGIQDDGLNEYGELERFVKNSDLASAAIDINDDHSIDDAERERQLAALFAEHGFEMEFV